MRLLVTPIRMHAATNTATSFLNGILTEPPRNLGVSGELIMALSALTVAAVLVVLTKGRLGYDGGSATPARDPWTATEPRRR